uniref:Putative ufm1-specific protease 2 n=1 Tax=Panstrongylus lignarius TaxID=156445 RepID=A0A224XKS4_9HEMI
MFPKIVLTRPVFMRLNEALGNHTGEIFGIIYNGIVLITGLNFDSNDSIGRENLRLYNQNIYPAGVDWCGLFQVNQTQTTNVDNKFLSRLKDIAVTNNPILLTRIIDKAILKASVFYIDGLRDTDFTIMEEEEFAQTFLHIRIRSRRTINVATDKHDSIIKDLHKFRKKLSSGAAVFNFKETEFYIHNDELDNVPSNTSLGDICETDTHPTEIRNSFIQGPYEVTVIFLVSDSDIEREHVCSDEYLLSDVDEVTECDKVGAPLVRTTALRNTRNGRLHLPIDILCIAQRERLVQNLYDILMEALYRWLDLIRLYLTKSFSEHIESTPVQICHFYPIPLSHYVSLIYPKEETDESLVEKRAALHLLFNLPTSQPFFRQGNVLQFGKKSVGLNVHHGLRYNGVSNGQRALVKGCYEYYHYLQDSFDDRGWGCAYRSFQTIFSWFRLQGYTTKKVPSHKEIQACLVKLGDKPASFIGSHNWIGSTELSFCLDEMLGVSSIILNVSSGQELCTLGSQLLYHFRTAGTPVMIGGGNLAHTILGIDFNEESGAIMFLILDPHFVASGDKNYLTLIQTKGGVFWKGLHFWSQNNFYNLCLAQPTSSY